MTKPWARTELHFGKFTNILGNDRQHNDTNVFDQKPLVARAGID